MLRRDCSNLLISDMSIAILRAAPGPSSGEVRILSGLRDRAAYANLEKECGLPVFFADEEDGLIHQASFLGSAFVRFACDLVVVPSV
jgi:hypothetical protein